MKFHAFVVPEEAHTYYAWVGKVSKHTPAKSNLESGSESWEIVSI